MMDMATVKPVFPAITALLCFCASGVALALIALNKGAKVNVTWALLAIGAAAFGVSGLFEFAGLFLEWSAAAQAVGAACLFSGAVHARSLYRKLLK